MSTSTYKKPKYFKKQFVFDCALNHYSNEQSATLANALTSQANQVCEVNKKFKPTDKYEDKFISLLVDSKINNGKLYLDLNIKHNNSSFQFNSKKVSEVVNSVIKDTKLVQEISSKKLRKPLAPLKLPPKKGQPIIVDEDVSDVASEANSEDVSEVVSQQSASATPITARHQSQVIAMQSPQSQVIALQSPQSQSPQSPQPISNITELIKKAIGDEALVDLPDIEALPPSKAIKPKAKPTALKPKPKPQPTTQIKQLIYTDSDVDTADSSDEEDDDGYTTDRYNEEFKLFKLSEKKREMRKVEREDNVQTPHCTPQAKQITQVQTPQAKPTAEKKDESWLSFFNEDRVVSFCVGLIIGTKLK